MPGTAAAAAAKVSVAVPVPGAAMALGEKVPVTFAGSPLTASETAELKPAPPDTYTTRAVEPPGETLTPVAPVANAKVG